MPRSPKSTPRCLSAPPDMASVTSTSPASISEAHILVQGLSGRDKPGDQTQQKLNKAIRRIKAHISSRHRETSLHLQLDPELIGSSQITEFLDKTGVRYGFDENTLFVYGMNSSIHDTLSTFAVEFLERFKHEVLMPEEARNLRVKASSARMTGRIKGHGTKRQTSHKAPDQGFVFHDTHSHCFYRTVIFESGFSETHDDLIRDMKQWLLHSRDGQVQLVILADTNEDERQLKKIQKSDPFRHRAAKILQDFGNLLGRSKHADILSLTTEKCVQQGDLASDISSASVMKLDYRIADAVQAEDWIGPITADLEIWELKNSEPYRRGRARAFPELVGTLPPIYAGDVIPLSYQGPSFDASRKLDLDLEDFRNCLLASINDYAIERALEFACPKSGDSDEDYEE